MLIGYNLLMAVGTLIGLPIVAALLVQSKRRKTAVHRLGLRLAPRSWATAIGGAERRASQPIWIHALSVGEVLSAEPILDRMASQFPERRLVFSASTFTGLQTARHLFTGKVASIFYYPYDVIFSVRRIVRHVDPAAVVIVETDIWPNFLGYLKRRGVPVVLINARLSQRSFKGYRLLGSAMRQALGCFRKIGVQSALDAARFIRLGMPDSLVTITGNVKFDQKHSPEPLMYGRTLRQSMGVDPQRKIMILGSTHPGEEEIAIEAYLRLKKQICDLMLIVAPRDPGRAEDLAKLCRRQKLSTGFLSSLDYDDLRGHRDVLVVNAIGILRYLYALADIAFVGGSIVPAGGHNPLEPAAFAKPVLFGPHMTDFFSIAEKLIQAGGAVRVCNSRDLAGAAFDLLTDDARRVDMGSKACRVILENKGAIDKTMDVITLMLMREPEDSGRMA